MKHTDTRNPCYDDIINLPHHVSAVHPHMPVSDRAAQFSPFAALTGYKESIEEAGRLTAEKRVLDENEKSILNGKLQFLLERAQDTPASAEITYYQPDSTKSGGSYITYAGRIQRADRNKRMLIMQDGQKIPIDDIADISYPL